MTWNSSLFCNLLRPGMFSRKEKEKKKSKWTIYNDDIPLEVQPVKNVGPPYIRVIKIPKKKNGDFGLALSEGKYVGLHNKTQNSLSPNSFFFVDAVSKIDGLFLMEKLIEVNDVPVTSMRKSAITDAIKSSKFLKLKVETLPENIELYNWFNGTDRLICDTTAKDQSSSCMWVKHREGYLLGKVIGPTKSELVKCEVAAGTIICFKRDILEHVNPSQLDSVGNLLNLVYFNLSSVLHVLRTRFSIGLYFTQLGQDLLFLNPIRTLPVFNAKIRKAIGEHSERIEVPHIYVTMKNVLMKMKVNRRDQCIVFLGLSGGGKTCLCSESLRFLCYNTKVDFGLSEDKLMNLCVLLQAFGNGVKDLNTNASNCVQVVEIRFNHNFEMTGGAVELICPEFPHKIHHINMLSVLQGVDKVWAKNLFLGEALVDNLPDKSSSVTFDIILEALMNWGASMIEIEWIMKIIASIYHFSCKNRAEGVKRIAKLLMVSEDDVNKFLYDCGSAETASFYLYFELLRTVEYVINRDFGKHVTQPWYSVMLVDAPGFQRNKDGQAGTLWDLCTNYTCDKLLSYKYKCQSRNALVDETLPETLRCFENLCLGENSSVSRRLGLLEVLDRGGNQIGDEELPMLKRFCSESGWSDVLSFPPKPATISVKHLNAFIVDYDTTNWLKQLSTRAVDAWEFLGLSKCNPNFPSQNYWDKFTTHFPEADVPKSPLLKHMLKMNHVLLKLETKQPTFVTCFVYKPPSKSLTGRQSNDVPFLTAQVTGLGIIHALNQSAGPSDYSLKAPEILSKAAIGRSKGSSSTIAKRLLDFLDVCQHQFDLCDETVKFSETNNRQFYFELKPAGDVNENHRIESTMVNLVSLPIPKLTRSDEVEGEVLRNQDKEFIIDEKKVITPPKVLPKSSRLKKRVLSHLEYFSSQFPRKDNHMNQTASMDNLVGQKSPLGSAARQETTQSPNHSDQTLTLENFSNHLGMLEVVEKTTPTVERPVELEHRKEDNASLDTPQVQNGTGLVTPSETSEDYVDCVQPLVDQCGQVQLPTDQKVQIESLLVQMMEKDREIINLKEENELLKKDESVGPSNEPLKLSRKELELAEENETLKSSIEQLKSANARLLHGKVAHFRNSLFENEENEIGRLKNKLKRYRCMVKTTKLQAESSVSEQSSAKLKSLFRLISDLKEEKGEFEKRLETAFYEDQENLRLLEEQSRKNRELQQKSVEQSREIRELKSRIDEVDENYGELVNQLETLQAKHSSTSKDLLDTKFSLNQTQEENLELHQEVEDLQKRISVIEQNVRDDGEILELKKSIVDAHTLVNSMGLQKGKDENLIKQLRKNVDSLNRQLELTKREANNRETYIKELLNKLSKQNDALRKTASDFNKLKNKCDLVNCTADFRERQLDGMKSQVDSMQGLLNSLDQLSESSEESDSSSD